MGEHRCLSFKKAVALYYSNNSDWIIRKNKGGTCLSVYAEEYGVEINYCPFCGRRLTERNKSDKDVGK